jgi:hypothetical protein
MIPSGEGVVYYGISEGVGHDRVWVRRHGQTQPLTHYKRKSPSGFSWGYAGSGPSELARCMLAEFLGLTPIAEEAPKRWNARPGDIPEIDGGLYQEFKFAFIAGLPQNGGSWQLEGEKIAAWLREHPPVKTCAAHRTPVDDDDPMLIQTGGCLACYEDAHRCPPCNGEGQTPEGDECAQCAGSGLRVEPVP